MEAGEAWAGEALAEGLAGSVVEGEGLAEVALREVGEPTGKNR